MHPKRLKRHVSQVLDPVQRVLSGTSKCYASARRPPVKTSDQGEKRTLPFKDIKGDRGEAGEHAQMLRSGS